MPYVKQSRKEQFEFTVKSANEDMERVGVSPGDLNYLVTELAKAYLAKNGLSYSTINDVVGALEGAKQEFYRRVAAPYEDAKIKENGDVYPGTTKKA